MGKRGFTLVELLVVIGIIAVLVGLLLPVLNKVRESAQRTQCASQLHQLAAAVTIYQTQFSQYPDPLLLVPLAAIAPTTQQPALYNVLANILGWTPVDATLPPATFPGVKQIDPLFNCPARMEFDLFTNWDGSYGVPWWTTGYGYFARLDESPAATSIELLPDRCCRKHGNHRGVLWADALTYADVHSPGSGYSFFHNKGGLKTDPTTGLSQSPEAVRGQHRAWSDGSVEWVLGSDIKLDPGTADLTASYRVSIPGAVTIWYWF